MKKEAQESKIAPVNSTNTKEQETKSIIKEAATTSTKLINGSNLSRDNQPSNSVALNWFIPKQKRIILTVFITLIVANLVAGAYYLSVRDNQKPAKNQQTTIQTTTQTTIQAPMPETSTPVNKTYIEPVFIDLDVTWQDPSVISLQGYYKKETQYENQSADNDSTTPVDATQNPVTYMLAGTFPGGRIIYVQRHFQIMYNKVDIFLVLDDQKPQLLRRYIVQEEPDDYDSEINLEKVQIDKQSIIKGTWAPDSLTINNQLMSLSTSINTGFYKQTGYRNNSDERLVEQRPEGKIYERIQKKNDYYLSTYELELPNFFRVNYELGGELSKSKVQPITWSDSSRNLDSYETFGRGCGGGGYALVANVTINDLIQIGQSDGGQKIYSFKDLTQPLAATILSEVNSRGDPNTWIVPETDPPYTAEEFNRDRAVIIVQDAMDRWIVFKNTKNFSKGGCAKPVIYLYPEKPTTLNVAVGADVTISEPFYEPGGWKNVTALPNGQLIYRGIPYDSLFWEGQGHGLYPDKSGYGFVVPRESVVTTLTEHMYAQGFNEKETNDFVEFWELNIPAGRYVRITWLDTAEMNQLAPLAVSVRPDTIIRTFLEMEGSSSYQTLIPQKFTKPARNGFVLTEWGGLAVNGLQSLNTPE